MNSLGYLKTISVNDATIKRSVTTGLNSRAQCYHAFYRHVGVYASAREYVSTCCACARAARVLYTYT